MIEKNKNVKKSLDVPDSTGQRELGLEISYTYTNATKDVHCAKKIKCNCIHFLLIINFVMVLLLTITTLVFWCQTSSNTNVNAETESVSKAPSPIQSSTITYSNVYETIVIYRSIWLAQPPTDDIEELATPVSSIIIHHTATPHCSTTAECILQTRLIQTFHMDSRNWSDIGYNFLIGGDGRIYEGRGWTRRGAHTYGYNGISLGVAFIGTFETKVPSDAEIRAFNILIEKGIQLGYIIKDYNILASRQFSDTKSPGEAFYNVITTWDHWSSKTP